MNERSLRAGAETRSHRPQDAYLEARGEEILASAMRVFVRKGLDGATMQDIASEAGLSAGAIYRYYDSKDALVRAAFEACAAQSESLFAEALAVAATPMEALLAAGRLVWDRFGQPGALDQFTLNLESALAAGRDPEGFGAEHHRGHLGVVEQLAELIRQSQDAGEITGDIDAHALALTLLSSLEGARVLYVESAGGFDPEPVYESLERMLQGLRPDTGRKED